MKSVSVVIRSNRGLIFGLIGLAVLLLALFGVVNRAGATVICTPPAVLVPPGICVVPLAPEPEAPFVHGYCDYGRNPRTYWPDNPDGHPYERPFCDGIGADNVGDPLDTPANNGLYCDEVPDCPSAGPLPGHH